MVDPSVIGISTVDPNALYESLFQVDPNDPNSLALDLSEFFDYSPTLIALIQDTIDPNNTNNDIPSFTAEGQGQIFRVNAGQFEPIPEPSTGLLLGIGLGLLAWVGRSAGRE